MLNKTAQTWIKISHAAVKCRDSTDSFHIEMDFEEKNKEIGYKRKEAD